MNYHRVCNKSIATGASSGAGSLLTRRPTLGMTERSWSKNKNADIKLSGQC